MKQAWPSTNSRSRKSHKLDSPIYLTRFIFLCASFLYIVSFVKFLFYILIHGGICYCFNGEVGVKYVRDVEVKCTPVVMRRRKRVWKVKTKDLNLRVHLNEGKSKVHYREVGVVPVIFLHGRQTSGLGANKTYPNLIRNLN